MPTKITIRDNGSIRVEGDFTIYDVNGTAFDLAGRETIGLCRCGQSQNKPFCDGTHAKIGFQSACPRPRLAASRTEGVRLSRPSSTGTS